MAKQDYYDTLGVGRDASAEQLKKAYRGLAMKFHPDRNPGDKTAEHKFKEISEAYDVLKDDQKRAAYNSFGHRAFKNGGGHPGGLGRGAEKAPNPVTCPPCRGHGKPRHSQGFFTVETVCGNCHGRGKIIDKPC